MPAGLASVRTIFQALTRFRRSPVSSACPHPQASLLVEDVGHVHTAGRGDADKGEHIERLATYNTRQKKGRLDVCEAP